MKDLAAEIQALRSMDRADGHQLYERADAINTSYGSEIAQVIAEADGPWFNNP